MLTFRKIAKPTGTSLWTVNTILVITYVTGVAEFICSMIKVQGRLVFHTIPGRISMSIVIERQNREGLHWGRGWAWTGLDLNITCMSGLDRRLLRTFCF